MTAARNSNPTTAHEVLHVAFELGCNEWKLAFTTGPAQSHRSRRSRLDIWKRSQGTPTNMTCIGFTQFTTLGYSSKPSSTPGTHGRNKNRPHRRPRRAPNTVHFSLSGLSRNLKMVGYGLT